MSNKGEFIILRGVLNYAKVIGKARPHTGLPKYDKGPYWSVDITPNQKSMDELEKHGLTRGGKNGTGKLRKPDMKKDKARAGATLRDGEVIPADGLYLSLKILENKADGEKNSPPSVKDVQNQSWDNRLIGNGSVADVKVKVVHYDGSESGVYLQNIRVLELVPYELDDMPPVDENDEYYVAPEPVTESQSAPAATVQDALDDLDDDVPF